MILSSKVMVGARSQTPESPMRTSPIAVGAEHLNSATAGTRPLIPTRPLILGNHALLAELGASLAGCCQ